MADPKTYSEQEHLAILSDRVAQETASLTAERDQLKADRDELQTKLDVAESARLAAEQAKETAEQAHETFKTEVAEREAAAARKETRVAEMKEKASHLGDEWFTEDRVQRIVAKSDEEFAAYVTDIVASVPAGGEGASREVPRETAMKGKQVGDEAPKTGAARAFLLRDYQQAGV